MQHKHFHPSNESKVSWFSEEESKKESGNFDMNWMLSKPEDSMSSPAG
jgi:hypothetical protein